MAEIEEKAANGSYRGLIIKGAGRHFSVGADVDALADRIRKIKNDKATAEAFGLRACEKAQKYTAASVVKQMRDIINTLERSNTK